jgi:hypothetical protein
MHMTATLTKWYEEKGRHEIVAGGKKVNLPTADHTLVLRMDDVNRERQHDLDDKGIAKTAREEKTRARDAKLKEAAKDAQMMKLYREQVLGEKVVEGLVPLGSIAPAAPVAKPVEKAKAEEVGSFGD